MSRSGRAVPELTTATLYSQAFQSRPSDRCSVYRTPLLVSSLTHFVDHITPVLMHVHWLLIKSRILYKLCLLMHLIHTIQWPAYMAKMVELTATSSSRSGLRSTSHLRTRRQRWKPSSVSEPSVMPALMPGTVSQTTFSLSQTPNFSRNFSKLIYLYCHFNSFIYFIVCRNMKCPPVYFVGGQ